MVVVHVVIIVIVVHGVIVMVVMRVVVVVIVMRAVVVMPAVAMAVSMAAGAVARRAVENISANSPGAVGAEVAAHPGVGGQSPAAAGGAGKRSVIAAEAAAADLGIEIGRQNEGRFHAVIVEVVVEIDAIGQRPISEIVAVSVQLIEIAERPQRASGLDPRAVGQAGPGESHDVRFFELELDRLAGVDAESEGEIAVELVVDVARHRDFAVAEREPIGAAFALVSGLEPGNFRVVVREASELAVEDHADRGVENVVLRHPRRWRGCGRIRVGDAGLGFKGLQLFFQGPNAGLVLALQGADLLRQFGGGGRRRRLSERLRHRQQQ